MMALPPSAGTVQLTVAEALPGTALTPVGAPGTVAGVTALDGLDGGPVPVPLVAVTVKVYGVPLVRPVTRRGVPVGPELAARSGWRSRCSR